MPRNMAHMLVAIHRVHVDDGMEDQTMKSPLTRRDWEEFWITCYLGGDAQKDYLGASIGAAYRDMCRTLRGFASQEGHEDIRKNAASVLKICIAALHDQAPTFSGQADFDQWHKETCSTLRSAMPNRLTVGQAQKWVNMTLKYIAALGSERVPGFAGVYAWCHVPLDNIVLEELRKRGFEPFECAWSQLTRYRSYMRCQNWIRYKWPGRPGLEVEYDLWQGDGGVGGFRQRTP